MRVDEFELEIPPLAVIAMCSRHGGAACNFGFLAKLEPRLLEAARSRALFSGGATGRRRVD
jgi:hypothetical protein